VLNLRKDTEFNARVVDCSWDDDAGEWTVKTQQGHVAKTRFLLLCSGLLHHRHIPDLPGLKDYKGELYHSSFYPEDLNLKGKRVGLVGTGATAVQITQDVAKQADHLTIFMRRPSTCLPAQQRPVSEVENRAWHQYLGAVFKESRTSRNGFLPTKQPAQMTLDVPEEERHKLWEDLFGRGAFAFWTQSYPDLLLSKEANALHCTSFERFLILQTGAATQPPKFESSSRLVADANL
jgi:cation diffusion facilitator CzcD-associated flavoprotein CzcO